VCRIRDVILKLPTPYALSSYWINIEFTGTTNCSKIFLDDTKIDVIYLDDISFLKVFPIQF
jgi:hypothetical protein